MDTVTITRDDIPGSVNAPLAAKPTRDSLSVCGSRDHSTSAPASVHTISDSLSFAGNILFPFTAFKIFGYAVSKTQYERFVNSVNITPYRNSVNII